MNTAKLKRFATEARNKLIQGVANRLTALGFDDKGNPKESPIEVAGGAVWKGKACTMAFYRGFKALEEQLRKHGVNHVVEEAAYIWFNRLMAIRILAMNQLCEPVLRYAGTTRTPFIVDDAREGHIPDMNDENRKALMQLLDDDTKTTEQFALLITAFCHNTPLISKCFGLSSDYTDILIPANILSEGGFIDMLNSSDFITEDDYHSSELLGWLYQFYISEKKDQVFAKKGKYDADDIPAATQIFTPNWIVKYMVQNTIGGVLGGKEMLPENHRKYYVDTPEEPTAICHDIEDMKVADLACGSGHILNECFDVLYDLYISEGYTRREAIECIFTKNLTGIDIDTRAKQLATFALMLKACQRDSSLVDASLMPRVYDMSGMPEESRELGSIQIFNKPNSENPVIAALSTQYDAIVMNPPYMPTNKIDVLSHYVNKHYKEGKADMFAVFMMVCMERLREGGRMGMINMQSWMFLSSFEALRKLFLKEYTLSSMLHLGPRTFDELSGEVVQNTAFVFEKLKPTEEASGVYYRLVDGKNCADKERMFLAEENRYDVPQSNFEKIPGSPFGYWVSEKMIEAFHADNLMSNKAIARSGFSTGDNTKFTRFWHEVAFDKIGFNLDNNDSFTNSSYKFVPYTAGGGFRRWYGNLDSIVDWRKRDEMHRPRTTYMNLYYKPAITWNAITSGKISCRCYGNGFLFEHAAATMFVNEGEDYRDFLAYLNSNIFQNILKILNPTLNNGGDVVLSAPIIIPNGVGNIVEENISISKADWDAHETSWDFQINPLLQNYSEIYDSVEIFKDSREADIEILFPESVRCDANLTERIESVKLDSCTIRSRYIAYRKYWTNQFKQLWRNEEEINRKFINIYELDDELDSQVPYSEITILQQGEVTPDADDVDGVVLCWHSDVVMKQLISYAVGCMMGRYRLDRPGLAIAHPNETPEEVAEYEIPGTDEKFWIDTDGIIPLLPENCGFHDNAVNRMATFVRQVFGNDTQSENLNFIEQCLGKSLEQYFIKDFWKDHKKMYQNRPIYWLFASKKGAFQVLVYVHRMNVATVERIRSRYLLPYIERLNKRIDDLQANESTLSTKQRNQLKTLRAQVAECEEYHNRLAVIAERGIVPDLDAGIPANHALYGDIVTKLK